MITPSFGLTATERVLPKLELDFTTGALDSRVTFTRTTDATHPATYVNSSGIVVAATNNQPRLDYDPVALVCKGLLIEESRTNSLTYSEDISQAVWAKTNTTVGATSTTSPSGGLTDSVSATTPGSYLEFYQNQTVSASATYSYSAFIKSSVSVSGTLRVRDVATVANRADGIFNLTNKTFIVAAYGTYTNATGKLTQVADGWYKAEMTFTVGANVSVKAGLYQSGVESGGFYIWGCQNEAGAFATSYIPTTTASLTRNADVATITGTAFSGFWRSGPGSILVRALPSTVSGTRPLVQVDDATADNIIALRGNTTNPELYIREGGADKATIDAGTISAAAYRLAGAWQAGSAAASLNSGLAVNGAPASIPAATQMRLGSDGTNYLNGHLQAVEYWDEFLTPATLQSVTTSAGYRSIIGPVMRDAIIA